MISPQRMLVTCLTALAFAASGCGECTRDGDCDDGLFCNGEEGCHSNRCIPGASDICNDDLACTADRCDEDSDECFHDAEDQDGDGHFAPGCGGDDCDDGDAETFAGAEEQCDGLDNDCNGVVDEDRDDDGHYDESFCPFGDDCDDSDESVFPGAPEVCDGVDNNCVNGVDDEADTDLDGSTDTTCGGDDCDDEDPTVSPLAAELCNGADDNCDGEPDETFTCIRGEDYPCWTPCGSLGQVRCSDTCTLSTDPDDCDPPDETCNGEDDDCDGDVDEGFPCVPGQPAECVTTCGSIGVGICLAGCEPARPEHCEPPAETCNGIDDDCDLVPDQDFPCVAGEVGDCPTTCGTIGTGLCSDDCEPAEGDQCEPPAEVCTDFVDNDCDLDVDCTDYDCIGDFACG